jgi:hypothetical protein
MLYPSGWLLLESWRPRLAKLGLDYHDESPTEACIICLYYGFAIKADGVRVTRHLHEKHHVPEGGRVGLHAFIRALQLPGPMGIRPWLDDRGRIANSPCRRASPAVIVGCATQAGRSSNGLVRMRELRITGKIELVVAFALY